MGFVTRLHTVSTDDGRWRLTRPLAWYDRQEHQVRLVPAGFVTDYASVPRIPFIFALCGDTGHQAATLHDYLYGCRRDEFTRRDADAIFLRALADADNDDLEDREHAIRIGDLPGWHLALEYGCMKALKVGRAIRRYVMWLGVRVGGWMPWYCQRSITGRHLRRRACPVEQTPR